MRTLAVFVLTGGLLTMVASMPVAAQSGDDDYTVFRIAPSAADARLAAGEPEHLVIYNAAAKPGNILLFLAGTGGKPQMTWFLREAVAHGYRVIYLSYIDTPAVAQTCYGYVLHDDPNCAQEFRERRIYGDGTAPIQDAPQDAIVSRFTNLLQYLTASDPHGAWNQYLSAGAPVWARVAVSGQSQGGGMAEFIAQRQTVARAIVFSGGWDHSSLHGIAHWYFGKSVTPSERWYGTYNVAEPMAQTIAASYEALGVPKSQTFALDRPTLPGVPAHADGVSNPAYRDVWDVMLGNGAL